MDRQRLGSVGRLAITAAAIAALALLSALLAPAIGGAATAANSLGTAASANSCPAAPPGKTAVVLVVDGPADSSTRCAVVSDRANGAEALAATGHSVRVEGGFICAIDGSPASGCAQGDSTAMFWSYWHAPPGGSWTYSRAGAYSYRLHSGCAVEGWHLVDPQNKTPPGVSAGSLGCAAPVTTPPTQPPPPLTAPAPSSQSGGEAPAAGPNPAPGVSPQQGDHLQAGNEPSEDPKAAVGSETTVASDEAEASEKPAATKPAVDPASEPDRATGDSPGAEDEWVELAATSSDADKDDDSGSGSPVGVILVVLLMGTLATALFIQRRKWTTPPS